jgi:hypothetical protein
MQNLQDTVASVQNAPSSIFTKDDVLNLLNGIEVTENVTKINPLTDFQIQSLIKTINEAIDDNASNIDNDCVDRDSAEFTLNYNNCIELDSVGFDSDSIVSTLTNGLDETIEEWFEKAFPDKEGEESEDEESNN